MRVFEGQEAFLASRADAALGAGRDVTDAVRTILDRVRSDGDQALIELARELDSTTVTSLRVSDDEIRASASKASIEIREVLKRAAENIRAFHENQRDSGFRRELEDGSVLGQVVKPLSRVGVYVPGGAASYPSTVLMNVIPARIAGVPRIVLCSPPGAVERSPELAAAIEEVSVEEVYRVGGAQAVGALAYGTATVPRVDKIVGPGNAFVAEAKRLVYGTVGIDAIAGPSEIVVMADQSADPRYVAADLLSQAEHGSGDESAILVTTSLKLAESVSREVDAQLQTLPRADAAARVLDAHGAIVVVSTPEEALAVVDAIAPEHLEIQMDDARAIGERVRHAGAIFIGPHAPVPVGDFFAGPNHVLPTGGTARFASPLGVYDFVKRTSWTEYSPERLREQRSDIEAFARAEGFEAHARAISIRFEK